MKITVLASGSKGNVTAIEFDNDLYLIDCGLTYRQIKLRLEEQGKSLDTLKGIFITHEHRDHTSGLRVLLNNHQVPIYLSEGSFKGMHKRFIGEIDPKQIVFLVEESIIQLPGFEVLPFSTYHDAIEPLGFKFIEKDASFVFMTDTGYFPIRKYDLIKNATAYMVESNYETELLLESERPWMLKRRILDDEGHLSNEDSANLIAGLIGDKTKVIILAHLSQDCNMPIIARESYEAVFIENKKDISQYELIIAKQHLSLNEIIIQ